MFFALVLTHLARIEDRFSFRGKSSAARILGTRTECGTMDSGHVFNRNEENVTVCGQKYAQVGLFLDCYHWKCFLSRSVAFLGKLSHQYGCRSLES